MVVLWFSVFARWLQMKSISSSESYSPLLVIHKGKKTAVFNPLEATNWDLSSGQNLESLVLTSVTFMSDVKMQCCITIKSKNTSSRRTSFKNKQCTAPNIQFLPQGMISDNWLLCFLMYSWRLSYSICKIQTELTIVLRKWNLCFKSEAVYPLQWILT